MVPLSCCAPRSGVTAHFNYFSPRAVSCFGTLLAGDFAAGMRESLLLAAGLITITALGSAALLPRR
ncbi:hypothetical protein [Streptomyces sp. NPDC014733]|uniref:hypothetical protein n=1 Tax=Streptomyces sp. NPDC014733 TaxID=3364885 RepID=UPI0036F8BBEB